jgi:hypothetical protein
VRITDIGGEEFDIAPASVVAEVRDQRRHYECRVRVGLRDDLN